MPSPDLSPFIDLSLNDMTAQTLFTESQDRFLALVPDWIPRESNIEVMLMEALAVQNNELVYAINRLPNSLVEALVALQGQTRDAGAPPTVSLEFTMVDDAGYLIPAGTEVLVSSGDTEMTFTTVEDLAVLPAALTGTVLAVGSAYTSAINGVSVADCTLINGLIYIDSVALDTAIANGADAETDAEYFARATALFQRMTTTLILPDHFVSYALSAGVFRAYALDNYDPTDSGSSPGVSGGHMTVAVYGTGAALSAPEKAVLQASMDAASSANLIVHVIDAVVHTVNINVTVQAMPDTDPVTVTASVQAALASYMSIASWDWSDTVLRNNLIAVITYVQDVSHVVTLTTPAADVTWGTYGNLAVLGTCTVTVT